MKAIIMAGGEGIRLRPLTCSLPKPLAPLCGRPAVYYILDLLNRHGVSEAVFTLGYKGGMIERLFENCRYKNIFLGFSDEDKPLGTAGCVKKALKNVSENDGEPFLVISGDALCDFDLTSALEFHSRNRAAATIITKSVGDPREYGLVIANDSGKITGFSEKPSYPGCISDRANTGVYILSPSVSELIPDNCSADFARDIFPKMLKAETPLYSYAENGYWCDIGNFETYFESQRDILTGKVGCEIKGRKLADGIYTSSIIPDGIAVSAPCHIGENVSFGENAVIRGSIIGDNVRIGSGAKITDSVVLDGAAVSDKATVNGAVICQNAKLMSGSSAFEGAVIGAGAAVGKDAVIGAGARVWNEKAVAPGASITRDIKYGGGSKTGIAFTERGLIGETNTEITPELCALLGAALNAVSPRIAVSSGESGAAGAMKYAIMAGASGAGGEVFDIGEAGKPQLVFAANLLDCGVTARVKCSVFTEIEVLSRGGLPLTRPEERKLEAALSRSEYRRADWNGFGKISFISGSETMYAADLRRYANFKSAYKIRLNCNNTRLLNLLSPIFAEISDNSGEVLVITLTDGGSAAEFYTERDIKIGYDKLLLLAAADVMRNGSDAALPNDFASRADFIAESYGRKIRRYFLSSNDDGDLHARRLAEKQGFLRDGAVLALNVLETLSQNNMTVEDAIGAIPEFARERRVIDINCPPQKIISRLCKDVSGYGEGVVLGESGESVLLRSSKKGDSLLLFAESLSSETAKELCDSAEDLVKKIMESDKNA